MDKQTLSNYGWIVICILVLSIMIGFATPFASFIANGFEAVYNGLFETENKALKAVLFQFGVVDDEGDAGEEIYSASAEDIVYRIGSGETLSITIPAPVSQFKRVEVDGTKITLNQDYNIGNSATYSARAVAGTTITFKESYLRKLGEKEHQIKIVAEGGHASVTLTTIYTNMLNAENITTGYIAPDGTINNIVDTLCYTAKLPVKEGDKLSFYHYSSGATPISARFFAAYDANGNIVESAGGEGITTYTTPKGISYVVATFNASSIASTMILKNATREPIKFTPFNSEDAGVVDIADFINVLDLSDLHPGYVATNGAISSSNDTLAHTRRIKVEPGDTFILWCFTSMGCFKNGMRFVTAYDASGNAIEEKGEDIAYEYTVPAGIDSLVFTVSATSANQSVIIKNNSSMPPIFFKYNGNNETMDIFALSDFVNLYNKEAATLGKYMGDNGGVSSSSSLCYSNKIAVEPGDTLYFWNNSTAYNPRFITAFDANDNVVASAGANSGMTPYTVPAGIKSIVVTIYTSANDTFMVFKNKSITPPQYIPYVGTTPDTPDIPDEPEAPSFINVFNKDTITSGYYVGTNGAKSASSSLYYSEKIAVKPGDIVYFYKNASTPYGPRFITAYDSDGYAVASAGVNSAGTTYTVPDGIYSIVFTSYISTGAPDNFMVIINNDQMPTEYVPYNLIPEMPEIPDFVNVFNKAEIRSGYYMSTAGGASASSSLYYSGKIYVSPGDTVYFYKNASAPYGPRFITAYDIEGNAVSGAGVNSAGSTYTVPDGIYSIIFTSYITSGPSDTFMVFINNEKAPTEYIPYVEGNNVDNTPEKEETEIVFNEKWLYSENNSMSTSTTISLGKADVITDKTLYFKADITSFSGLRLGHGYTSYTANYIEIDATNIRQYSYISGTQLMMEKAHGLTINKDIEVKIQVNHRRVATITITSDGKSFTCNTSTNWYGSNGEIFATSLGSTLTNASLGFTCDGYSDSIQFYGDSYLSQSSDRWLHFAFNDGYKNALFDGFGGRGSSGAYTSLVENLKHSDPEIVVWLLGMNDGSDTDINTPSSAWANTRDKLIALAEQEGFELVFATIPSVPGINHEAKNKWIRESGYRYIDVAEAVSATPEGAWSDGMLASDNIHPSALGSEAIYQKVIEALPEFKVR